MALVLPEGWCGKVIRQVSSSETPPTKHPRRSRNWVKPSVGLAGSASPKTNGEDFPPPPSSRPPSRPPIPCTRLQTQIATRNTKGSSTAVRAEDKFTAPKGSPPVVPSARIITRLQARIAAK
ncbi:hypothetical protein Mapa_012486 [Marchantia paleacea]|nr:hypothetical protein Mapa_012486 [Marchantia paleacea]